jgi:hypothetical protein
MSKIDENWGMLRSEWEGLVDDPKNIQVEQLLSNIIRAEERIPKMVKRGRLTPEEVKGREAEIEYAKGLVKKHVTPAMIENLKDDPISKQLFAVKQAGGVEKMVAFAKKITSEKAPSQPTNLKNEVMKLIKDKRIPHSRRQRLSALLSGLKSSERREETGLGIAFSTVKEATQKLQETIDRYKKEFNIGDPAGKKGGGGGGGGKPGKPNAYWAKVREIQKTGVPEGQAKKRAEKELSGDSGDSFDTESQFNRRWDPSRQKWINSDSYDAL